MKTMILRLLREPLLHFFAVGGLVFVFYANAGNRTENTPGVIDISAAQVEQQAAQFSSVWKRPPTDDELDHVIEDFIREEVYYREALALHLDQGDAVVRQRLRQKMEFLTDNSAQLLTPTEAELQAYLAANEIKYQQGARRSLEQVFLGQTPSVERVTDVLTKLQSDSNLQRDGLGERTMLPGELSLALPQAIDSVYGSGFFEQIQDLSPGQWFGPVVSAYGIHLVRILDSQAAPAMPEAKMREAIIRDWQAEKATELRELDYAERKSHFEVRIDDRDAQTEEAH
jgi:hypothetical protein